MKHTASRRRLYATPEEVLILLLNDKIKISTLYTHKHRCLYIYKDMKQAEIIAKGITLYKSYHRIKNIEI